MKKHTMPGFMTYREVALIYAALDDETAGKVIKAVCDYYCFGYETDGFTGRAAEIYDTMLCKMETTSGVMPIGRTGLKAADPQKGSAN